MRIRNPAFGALALLPALSLNVLPTCGGGGGGGGPKLSNLTVPENEPNDDSLFATGLFPGRPTRGDLLGTDDVDWYFIHLVPGSTIKIELWATRLDQASWDASGTGPHLTVYFPSPAAKLIEQSSSVGWTFGAIDIDVPAYTLPTNGSGYWIKVEPETAGVPGGRYVLRVSYVRVGIGPREKESGGEVGGNDSTGTAETIVPGVLDCFHRPANDDCFALTVTGPSVLRAEVIGQRNGAEFGDVSMYDPLLRLFAADGTTVLAENDDAFLLDPAIQFEVSAAGRYVFQVSENPANTTGSKYRLITSVTPATATPETEPNDVTSNANAFDYGQNVSGTIGPGEEDWFQFTGAAGDMVRLQVFDGNNSESGSEAVDVALLASDGVTPIPFHEGPLFQALTTILRQNGTVFVRVRPGASAVDPTTYRLELRRFKSATFETEPNDTLAQAPAFPPGGLAAGEIAAPGDVDVYRFSAVSEQLITFSIFAGDAATGTNQQAEYSGNGSALAPLLQIRDVNGNVIASSTSLPANGVFTEAVTDGLPTATVAFVAPPTSHVYYVEVAAADGTGGDDHTYVLLRR